jgi:hypothetical protein
LSGEVEMDETFVGGKIKNMHKAKIAKITEGKKGFQGGRGKTIVGRAAKSATYPRSDSLPGSSA